MNHKVTQADLKLHLNPSDTLRRSQKVEKNLPLCLNVTKKFQKMWKIFSNFVAFSQYLKFLTTYGYMHSPTISRENFQYLVEQKE